MTLLFVSSSQPVLRRLFLVVGSGLYIRPRGWRLLLSSSVPFLGSILGIFTICMCKETAILVAFFDICLRLPAVSSRFIVLVHIKCSQFLVHPLGLASYQFTLSYYLHAAISCHPVDCPRPLVARAVIFIVAAGVLGFITSASWPPVIVSS